MSPTIGAVAASFRRAAAGGGGLPTDPEFTDLVAAITGGNAALSAAYSVNFNVTRNTGVTPNQVTQWDDMRGASGYGPSLVVPTGRQAPLWDSANTEMYATANFGNSSAAQELASAVDARLGLSDAKTLIYIGTCEDQPFLAPDFFCAIASDGSGGPDRMLAVMQHPGILSGNVLGHVRAGGTEAYASTQIGLDGTRRMFVASKAAGSGTLQAQVPNKAVNAGGTSGSASPVLGTGDNALALFNHGTSSGTTNNHSGVGKARALIVIDHQIDATETAAIFSWAQTYHAAAAAT